MTKLRFSDGEIFDTDGPLRIEERADGLYVIGAGLLMACGDREEAEALLRDMQERLEKKGGDA